MTTPIQDELGFAKKYNWQSDRELQLAVIMLREYREQVVEAYKDNACEELLDGLIASADSEGRLWVDTILTERSNLNKSKEGKLT